MIVCKVLRLGGMKKGPQHYFSCEPLWTLHKTSQLECLVFFVLEAFVYASLCLGVLSAKPMTAATMQAIPAIMKGIFQSLTLCAMSLKYPAT